MRIAFVTVAMLLPGPLAAAELPRGQIIDSVECRADAEQSYSLYLPSAYTPSRRWSVILAFDAGGRGRRAVERYQTAAEKYGYIIAGSNNSRNGPWDVSLTAAEAMKLDVEGRFSIDPKRVYTAGMSGGARVAMKMALDSWSVAGVFASSAAFPGEFHSKVPFAVFGSAGTDDFNHLEMSELDQNLATPHRVEYFDGGHAWLPVALAMDGVEWMELQAMKAGLRAKDPKAIDGWFANRTARANALMNPYAQWNELKSIEADFQGWKDVSAVKARISSLEHQDEVKDGLKAQRAEQERELKATAEIYQLRDRMAQASSFAKLKERVLQLLAQSKASNDSADRQIARRILSGFAASSRSIVNPEFQDLLQQIRPAAIPR